MSAIAFRTYPDRAYLLADGAFYDTDGVVQRIGTKLIVSDAHRIAFGVTGRIDPSWLLDASLIGSQPEIMGAIPYLMRQQRAENDRRDPAHADTNDFQVFVVMWNEQMGGSGWAISTNQAWFGDAYVPFSWSCLHEAASPSPQSKKPGWMPIRYGSPEEDGRALLEAQRAMPEPDGRFYVGGFGEMVTVDRQGARLVQICDWPDEVGKLIAA